MSRLGVISDMDGVIYRGKRVILLQRLRTTSSAVVGLSHDSS